MPAAGPDKERCGAKASKGPCKRVAGAGTDHLGVGRCSRHGGSTITHRQGAKAELVRREASKILRAEGYEPDFEPVEELLSLGAEVVAFKDILRRKVSVLEDWTHESDLGAEDIKAIVSTYERACDRTERVAANMLKLGLKDRKTKLEETQSKLFANAFMEALALSNGTNTDEVVAEFQRLLGVLAASEPESC